MYVVWNIKLGIFMQDCMAPYAVECLSKIQRIYNNILIGVDKLVNVCR